VLGRTSNTQLSALRGEQKRRRDFEAIIQRFNCASGVSTPASPLELLIRLADNARQQCVAEQSKVTYATGMRRFVAFLACLGTVLAVVVQAQDWQDYPRAFMAYLYYYEQIRVKSIITYLAGVQHYLKVRDYRVSVWSMALHQQIKGHERDDDEVFPGRNKIKIPFTRHMILKAWECVLSRMENQALALALYAALCLAFLFLFRKSEYLTGKDRQPKVIGVKVATLQAKNVQFHYSDGRIFTAAAGHALPAEVPEFLSMRLNCSKNDQLGKGASRFAPSCPKNPHCLVRVVHTYCRIAGLRPDDPIFAGPSLLVSDDMLAFIMRRTAIACGLPPELVSIHSIRVGGLVALMAAGIPDELKMLAGRWKTAQGFLVYARSTIQQYSAITAALNDISLVTSEHVRMLYEHTFNHYK